MAKYIVTSECEAQIGEVVNYIAKDSVEAAFLFYERLTKTFRLLSENPKLGRERGEISEGLRSFPIARYLIFYRIWAKEVAIVRVLHGARDLDDMFD